MGHDQDNSMNSTEAKTQNRLVWLLTVVGLGTGVIMLCTEALSLMKIREDRVSSELIRRQTTLLTGRADQLLGDFIHRSTALLDGRAADLSKDSGSTTGSPFESALPDGFDLAETDRSVGGAVSELTAAFGKLQSLQSDCEEFARRCLEIHQQRQESAKDSDSRLRALRASLKSAEGMQLLKMAVLIRRYRKLAGEEAMQAADQILQTWSPKSRQAELMGELADLAMFRERLLGETDVDDLVSLRDNRIQPCLSRLHRLVSIRAGSDNAAQDSQLLHELETSLFGVGFEQSRSHQSIRIGDGGLYSACVESLEAEQKREQLEMRQWQTVSEFRAVQRTLNERAESVIAESADRAAQLVTSAWHTMLLTGCITGLVFAFLAGKVAKTISRQFETLATQSRELARQTAEAEKLSLVAKYTDNSVVITDAAGHVEWVNEGFSRITGYSPEDAAGHVRVGLLQGPETDPEIVDDIVAGIEAGRPFDTEIQASRKNGDQIILSVEARPILDEDGKVRHFFQIERDVTEARHAEQERLRLTEALQESVAYTTKLALVAQHTSNAVIVSDADGCVEWVNEGFTRMTEYNLADVIGKKPGTFLYGEETDDAIVQQIDDAIASQSRFRGELVNYNKSGGTYWIDLEVLPVPDESGVVSRFISIVSDISERRKAASEKEAMELQLRSAAHQAGMAEVATGVLHNVGNVLNSVNVSASVLREKLLSGTLEKLTKSAEILTSKEDQLADFLTQDPRGQCFPRVFRKLTESMCAERDSEYEELESIQENIDHIKQIVSMQQSNAKHVGLIENLCPVSLFDDAISMNGESLGRHQISLVKEFSDVPAIAIDRHQTLQILVNLIINAKQAHEEGDADERKITLAIAAEGEYVRFDVIDNGPGMSDEVLGRLFQHRFTTKKNGHGFGLHASALSAKQMGGSLTAHSDGPGTGATFTLRLPLQTSQTEAVHQGQCP